MSETDEDKKSKIVAFRVPKATYDKLMHRAEDRESPSDLMRKVVGEFIDKKEE